MRSGMKMLAWAMALIAFGVMVCTTNAAEIKVFSAAGMRTVMEDLVPKFERTTGYKCIVTVAAHEVALRRLRAGEAADLAVLTEEGIAMLVKEGRATGATVSSLAKVGLGVGVRKGSPRPDISTPEAFKRALLVAKSITYPNPAAGNASGIYFQKVLEQLGIADAMKSKVVFVGSTNEMEPLLASGEVELAVNQLANLLTVNGLEIVGPLPGNLQQMIPFSGVVMNGSKNAVAAKALIDFLRMPEAAKVIKSKGLEPG